MATDGKARVKVWDVDAARRRAGLLLPDWFTDRIGSLRGLIAQWSLAEVAPERLLPWLPVAFGFGIVLYFTADREPNVWAASCAAVARIVVAFIARRRAFGFPLALGLAAIAAGFATATLKSVRIAHPVLQTTQSSVSLSGFVEIREERERSASFMCSAWMDCAVTSSLAAYVWQCARARRLR